MSRLKLKKGPDVSIVNTYKGREIKWNGKHYDSNEDDTLNELQRMHKAGEINVYQPIEAYYVEWHHDYKNGAHYPKEDTRVRKNLPCISQQWRDSYNRSLSNG